MTRSGFRLDSNHRWLLLWLLSSGALPILFYSIWCRNSELQSQSNVHSPVSDRNDSVTAVLLNWKRLANVVLVVGTLCESSTIDEILIWNNNPSVALTFEQHFSETGCNPKTITIHNSPENLYFEARYIACSQSKSALCFIQDDDFLITPAKIAAMVAYAEEAPIYLLPPDEYLSSTLRAIDLHTETGHSSVSFAWLGYGTLITKQHAKSVLNLMSDLSLSINERRMADNFFSIFQPTSPNIWLDKSVELGGEDVAFTQESEGDDRNWNYINLALAYQSLHHTKILQTQHVPRDRTVSFVPCVKSACVYMTNIRLISTEEARPLSSTDMRMIEVQRRESLGVHAADHFKSYSFANIAEPSTRDTFKSPSSPDGRKGEWITVDLLHLHNLKHVKLSLDINRCLVEHLELSISGENDSQAYSKHALSSFTSELKPESSQTLRIPLSVCGNEARYIRLELFNNVGCPWNIETMYVIGI